MGQWRFLSTGLSRPNSHYIHFKTKFSTNRWKDHDFHSYSQLTTNKEQWNETTHIFTLYTSCYQVVYDNKWQCLRQKLGCPWTLKNSAIKPHLLPYWWQPLSRRNKQLNIYRTMSQRRCTLPQRREKIFTCRIAPPSDGWTFING